MTTLMRNGRDRRSGEPASCHAIDKRVLLIGTRSADYIRASGHSGCIQRPNTWLHPNPSLKCQIPLATRASSIHGTKPECWRVRSHGGDRGSSRPRLNDHQTTQMTLSDIERASLHVALVL